MRSRRRRLQRQRKNSGLRFGALGAIYLTMWRKPLRDFAHAWGRPRGCFDHFGKTRSTAAR